MSASSTRCESCWKPADSDQLRRLGIRGLFPRHPPHQVELGVGRRGSERHKTVGESEKGSNGTDIPNVTMSKTDFSKPGLPFVGEFSYVQTTMQGEVEHNPVTLADRCGAVIDRYLIGQ